MAKLVIGKILELPSPVTTLNTLTPTLLVLTITKKADLLKVKGLQHYAQYIECTSSTLSQDANGKKDERDITLAFYRLQV